MAVRTRAVAPEYLSFYISGTDNFEVPIEFIEPQIVATPQCINVGCLYWNDGDTTITIGNFEEVDQGAPPQFDGILLTPDRVIILSDANMPEIMRAEVPNIRTRVRIWTNHRTEPDQVTIGLG